ncbi:hypothetical protein BVY04_02480 [bacterium M21]|nr:hypothetical protein BVY04_02480 [bacterium M21]
MTNHQRDNQLRRKVQHTAQEVLDRNGAVQLTDILSAMGWINVHQIQQWQKGHLPLLEAEMASTPGRRQMVFTTFGEWVQEHDLKVIPGQLQAAGRGGEVIALQATETAEKAVEELFANHYLPLNATTRKVNAVKKKAEKAPELMAYRKLGLSAECSDCKAEIRGGSIYFKEQDQALCLACADLDHLEFLPSGDAALSRRARKHSPLNAVVVEFARRKRRFERRGILVSRAAIEKAETECLNDADQRARQRERSARYRDQADKELAIDTVAEILRQFPSCPSAEAEEIALHATQRGSGRVGRSAAAKALEPDSVKLAVIAHIRHIHTNYDHLLMIGTPRTNCRDRIRDDVSRKLREWSSTR